MPLLLSDGGTPPPWAFSSSSSRPKQFCCEICQRRYSNKNSLQNHMGIHRGRTNCDICRTVFSSKSNLNLHMKNFHGRLG
jgi:hypothetical protein